MSELLKQIQNSSFEKSSVDNHFKMQLSTINGTLNLSVALDANINDAIFITITHKDIKEAIYAASLSFIEGSNLDTIIEDSINIFFKEIAKQYIGRYSVQ